MSTEFLRFLLYFGIFILVLGAMIFLAYLLVRMRKRNQKRE